MFYIKAADLLLKVDNKYDYIREACRDYIVEPDRPEDAWIAATDEQIEKSKKWHFDHGSGEVSLGYAEYTQAHQYLYSQIIRYDAFWMHAAVVSLDGSAYAFSANSGYGKSTHAHLWLKAFGDRARVINGDNPIIRKINGVYHAYGTPFCGKENEQENIGLPLKGVCYLNHGEENSIERLSEKEAFNRVFSGLFFTFKIIRPDNLEQALLLIEDFVEKVPVYLLTCNMDPSAAVTAYNGMNKADES